MRSSLIICALFLFSSCATGIVAVHDSFPYVCFLKGCRESQKMDSKRTKLISRSRTQGSRNKQRRKGNIVIIAKQDLKNKKKKYTPVHNTVSLK